MATLIDSYSESNYSAAVALSYSTNNPWGQAFACGSSGLSLDSAKFYLANSGGITGNATAKLYSLTGTYGSTAKPSTLLATSDTVANSSIGAGFGLITFNFSGANRVSLSNGTNYGIAVFSSTGDSTNRIIAGADSTPAHSGNAFYSADGGSTWSENGSYDICFYVYGAQGSTGNFFNLF